MSVGIIVNDVINLTSNGTSFKKENKDNKYYINCYVNSILKFRLQYDYEAVRDMEFELYLIDDVYNGKVNFDDNTKYTGQIVEVR